MLFDCQRSTMHELPAELYYKKLHCQSNSLYDEKHEIIKESFKYIDFRSFELPAIDLIKRL